MPDITAAQVVAVVGWALAQAVAYGWLDTEASQVVLSGATTVIGGAWVIADAFLRGKRNEVRAAAIVAGQPDPALKK